MSGSGKLVTVFGGSGFLGRHVVRALAKRGYRIRVAVRRPDLAGHLQPLGAVGQIHAVQANIRNRPSIDRAVEGADIVINLVGILFESGRNKFDAVQAFGAGAVAAAAKGAGAERLVHVSAIGADPESEADYVRSKAAGEAAVREQFPDAVIFRPSIVFGTDDGFFNKFAALARFSPVLPVMGDGTTRFQPIFVGDVAEAVARAADGDVGLGNIYELGGPEVATFRELMEITLRETGRKRILLPVPFALARIKAFFLQLLPNPFLTVDQVRLLEVDNVVSDEARDEGRTLEGLGIAGRTMAVVLPTYLYRYREAGQYSIPT